MRKLFAIAQADIYKSPGAQRIGTLPYGYWCEGIETAAGDLIQATVPYGKLSSTLWTQITFNGLTGWVYDPKLEEVNYVFVQDVVKIAHPTPNPYDLKQYLVLDDGKTLYNGCGEFCVAYIAGLSIDDFFQRWNVKNQPLFKRIVYGNRTTGTDDLRNMLAACGYEDAQVTPFTTMLYDGVLQRPLVSTGRLARLLETYSLIAGVHIDHNGRLNGSGVGHWVVAMQIEQNGFESGVVRIYNPAGNRIEFYSWQEFMASASSLLGLWVERVP